MMANAGSSCRSKGKSMRKFVLNRAVMVTGKGREGEEVKFNHRLFSDEYRFFFLELQKRDLVISFAAAAVASFTRLKIIILQYCPSFVKQGHGKVLAQWDEQRYSLVCLLLEDTSERSESRALKYPATPRWRRTPSSWKMHDVLTVLIAWWWAPSSARLIKWQYFPVSHTQIQNF